MELKLKTDVGELTAVFVSDMAGDKVAYTGWIKEYPGVVTQTDTISEGMKKMPDILNILLQVEKEINEEEQERLLQEALLIFDYRN